MHKTTNCGKILIWINLWITHVKYKIIFCFIISIKIPKHAKDNTFQKVCKTFAFCGILI